jgi:hypothetical protein
MELTEPPEYQDEIHCLARCPGVFGFLKPTVRRVGLVPMAMVVAVAGEVVAAMTMMILMEQVEEEAEQGEPGRQRAEPEVKVEAVLLEFLQWLLPLKH